MPFTINSANMAMPIPVVGVDPGPDWATNINACLTILDAHDHAPGSGVQITPDGLNINVDLTFNGNNATFMRSVRFDAQGAPLAGILDLGCIYESGVDLYYNDGIGNQIRITQGGSVAAAPGSITGLTPPASVVYDSGTGTFIFQSAVDTPAALDAASVTIREQVLNGEGVTITAPTGLAASYTLTLPAALPATGSSTVFVDSSGNIKFSKPSGIVVGTGGEYSTITAAIAAASAGDYITVLIGTYTENISLSKSLTIVGQGRGTVLNGTLTFASGSDETLWKMMKVTDNITINSGVSEITLLEFWLATGKTITDNGTGSMIQGMQE